MSQPSFLFAKLPQLSDDEASREDHGDDSGDGDLVINVRKLVHYVGVGVGKMLKTVIIKQTDGILESTCLMEVNLSPKYLKITMT